MTLNTLNDYFVDELRDVHDAEEQVLRILPRLKDSASSGRLKGALERHIGESRKQLDALRAIFKEMEEAPSGKKCLGMQGIIQEGEDLLGRTPQSAVKDVEIISTVQKIKHYEMAAYGCAAEYARKLGEKKVAESLERTLSQEKEFDRELTGMAENSINSWAAKAEAAAGR